MAGIQEYLDLIKNAVYGREVRQAIHDGIEECYKDGRAGAVDLEARARITNLATLVDGSTTGDAELIDARTVGSTTYPSLHVAIDTEVTDLKKGIEGNTNSFTDNNLNTDYAKVSTTRRTFNGLTFSAENGVMSINGTSTAVSLCDLFNKVNAPVNFPFKGGHRYAVRFTERGNERIYKQIAYQSTSGGATTTLYSQKVYEDVFMFSLPDDFYNMYIRILADGANQTFSNKQIVFSIIELPLFGLSRLDNSFLEAWQNGGFIYNKLSPYKDYTLSNWGGLQFENTNGIDFHVSGTATATNTLKILEDWNNSIFKPNDEIVISFKNPANKLYIEVVTQKNGTAHTPLLQTTSTGGYRCKFPEEFDYCRIDLLFFNNTSYDDDVSVEIKSVAKTKAQIIVAKDGTGDYTNLKDGIEEAIKAYGTTVIVKPGTYDLVAEYGKSYLDNLNGGDYGISLGNGINIIFAPNAYVSFDYDGANTWVIANFSPFNTANDLGYTIDGLHCTARNCRYILHDDPVSGTKTQFSKNVIKNCYFEMYPSPDYPSWVNHQIIGGGLGDATQINIENCIFNDHFNDVDRYSAVSYHNSTSGSADYESYIVVKDCVFNDGNMLVFEGYGSATSKTKVIVTNNNFQNANTDIVYNNTPDNMAVYRWNNVSR